MKIIVVTAHPDDLEISCAGTLKKLQDQQDADIVSVVTVRPSAEVRVGRNKDVVLQEMTKSYDISGWQLRVLDTDLHDCGRPNLVADNVTMTKLSALLEPCDIAIIPHPGDYHQDHVNTYKLAWPLLCKWAKEIWLMHTWPYCGHHQDRMANLYHDITDQWTFKQSLLQCYGSYFSQQQITQIQISNQYWGSLHCSESLCEAFTIATKYAR